MSEEDQSQLDKAQIQQRLDRISEIFAGMVTHAESVSRQRCPYRDRHDLCTALFRCRNQQPADTPQVLLCGHDGILDYRTAWETDPRSYERTKNRIAAIKQEAEQRRQAAGE